MKNTYLSLCLFIAPLLAQAQFAGPVDSANTSAIHMDSSIINSWAINCTVQRGFLNIKDTSLGKVSVGADSMAVGKAMNNGIVSLGDRGIATLTFAGKLFNGSGPDLAVFENAFDDNFLELAFVEVSSNGVDFVRFPSISQTATGSQIKSYDSLKTSRIHNLAGKYRMAYGTPFDLEDLAGISALDINNITHVRIIDVIGSIDTAYASLDSRGIMINDPYPTPWPNGGFDLDAVAAIHIQPTGMDENRLSDRIQLFPNPSNAFVHIQALENLSYSVYSAKGSLLYSGNQEPIDLRTYPDGLYFLKVFDGDEIAVKKIIKK